MNFLNKFTHPVVIYKNYFTRQIHDNKFYLNYPE
jgi:hypothetical protein